MLFSDALHWPLITGRWSQLHYDCVALSISIIVGSPDDNLYLSTLFVGWCIPPDKRVFVAIKLFYQRYFICNRLLTISSKRDEGIYCCLEFWGGTIFGSV